MKQNIAVLIVGWVLTACTLDIRAQVQSPPPQAPQPAPVIYNYVQQSWPQSAPTHQWEGYVPTGYQPPPNNAFDAAPASAVAYSVPYTTGCYAPGVGLSVGFGIGACSVGIGAHGIYAGVGLGCFPIGVGFGSWCN